ncbi:hypothetical protein [Aliarcobacter cryaerophilus]|uniref:hypothetical protein n=1 Tax=Aliarcobacter cryaerophilus TaxID=28198 RepID=UPI0021B616A7|nr:hypothetical protein [Aliarcobacter cryaerophilus]MCT7482538.1 hypothetical protein [Aliarcobacter cryaerophilus]
MNLSYSSSISSELIPSSVVSINSSISSLLLLSCGLELSIFVILALCLAFERNYKISTPLTLFIQYKKDSLEDVSVHIFLQLLNKWQTFYDEFKKESEKVCLKKYQFQ